MAAITSNFEEKQYGIVIKNEDLVEGDLKVDSIIRADKLYTMSQDIIIRRFGRAKGYIIEKVKKEINSLIDEK